MPLITRQYGPNAKGSRLTILEMDDNLLYLDSGYEYVATLTQLGGIDPQTTTSGVLTVGVTYEITDYVAGDNFTNVGAASNANGVKFVATDTTPTIWTNGSELSYDNGVPVVTVLKNTIGDVWFTYVGPGSYHINSNGLFTGTVPTVTNVFGVIESSTSNYITVDKLDDNTLRLASSDFQFNGQNSLLSGTPVTIKMYS